jgi:hypothetical protein
VPTLDEVRAKIETRLARAQGATELERESVQGRMLEVEQAAAASQASARLSEIRSKLGIAAPAATQAAQASKTETVEAPASAAEPAASESTSSDSGSEASS